MVKSEERLSATTRTMTILLSAWHCEHENTLTFQNTEGSVL